MRFRRLLPSYALAVSLTVVWTANAATPVPVPVPVVTILGDSITAGYGLRASDALPAQLEAALARHGVPATVRGAGVSGDTTAGGLARVDFSVASDTSVCVIELGANDYLQSVAPDETARNLDALVRSLRARRIRVLLLGGHVPAGSAGDTGPAFDAVFPRVARLDDVPLDPDFLAGVEDEPALKQADGLHPNAAGVAVMADRMAPYVIAALARPAA